MISKQACIGLLVAITVVLIAVGFWLPRIPQPQSYHLFADRRTFAGIPNFANVISNLPFAAVGLSGLVFLLRADSAKYFLDRRERWPYLIVFAGLVLTAFGSSYYHLQPDNASLLWDRLPMVIVFMSLA